MIQRAVVLPETALFLRKKTLWLKGPRHMRRALIILPVVLQRQLVNVMGRSFRSPSGLYRVWGWELLPLRAVMAEDGQIPRRGYTAWEEQIKQSVEDGLEVDNDEPGPSQRPSRFISVKGQFISLFNFRR